MLNSFFEDSLVDSLFFNPLVYRSNNGNKFCRFSSNNLARREYLSNNHNIFHHEDKNNVYLAFSVPGCEPDKINLSVEKNYIIVNAVSSHPLIPEEKISTSQSYWIPFEPQVENCIANIEYGILKVTIPKKSSFVSESSNKIPITSS